MLVHADHEEEGLGEDGQLGRRHMRTLHICRSLAAQVLCVTRGPAAVIATERRPSEENTSESPAPAHAQREERQSTRAAGAGEKEGSQRSCQANFCLSSSARYIWSIDQL